MKKPFLCKLGMHDWALEGKIMVPYVKRGPFDPKAGDEERYKFTCCQCGKVRLEYFEYLEYDCSF